MKTGYIGETPLRFWVIFGNLRLMGTTPREVCLDEIQRSVLIGTLLGDGGLRYRGKNCRLHVKHAEWQLPLVQYKYSIFQNIVSMKVNRFEQEVNGKKYRFAEFVTRTNIELTKYYHVFYKNGKKGVPVNIGDLLTSPLSLAMWFMDDGSAEYAGVSFQTHSFAMREVRRLRSCLKESFGLEATLRKNKGRWILYLPKRSLPRFRDLIQDYVLDEFRYKLTPYFEKKINPVETVRRDPMDTSDYDTVRSV